MLTPERQENIDKQVSVKSMSEILKEGSEAAKEITDKIYSEYEEKMNRTKELPERSKKILILDCSDTLPLGPLTILADEGLDASSTEMVDVVHNTDLIPQSLDNIAGIIITGSPSNIEDKDKPGFEWIKKTEEFVKYALDAGIPTLGVCFGIQMHADIEGREVPRNEGGRELGVWKTSIYRDATMPSHPILESVPFQKDLSSGEESAVIETVGAHAFRAGYDETHESQLYGFHYTEDGNTYPQLEIEGNFVGLQFHPEISSPRGLELMEALAKARYQLLKEAGKNPDEIIRELEDYRKRIEAGEQNVNLSFLTNFVKWALEEGGSEID